MGRLFFCSVVMLVAVSAATTSFAAADDGARKMNNGLIVAAEDGPAADLDYLIGTISKRVSKKMHRFERKTKDYFVKTQKAETIEAVMKQISPGEAITALVLSNLSKKPVQEIIDMKTSGAPWSDIAERSGVKLKVVVSDVKDFWLGSG